MPHQRLEEMSTHFPLQRLWPCGHPASSDQLTERRRLTLFVGLSAKVAAVTNILINKVHEQEVEDLRQVLLFVACAQLPTAG